MKFLFIDTGIAVPHAVALGKEGHEAYYYIAYHTPYPSIFETISGYGFPIKKVTHYEEVVDDVDVIMILDVGFGKLGDKLRERGKKVFGNSYKIELLEEDRTYFKKVLDKYNILYPPTKVITSVEEVLEEIRRNPGVYVKVNKFRGCIETFYASSYLDAKIMLYSDPLFLFNGKIEFQVEKEIDGIMIGYDIFYSNGVPLKPYFFTLEVPGTGNLYFAVESGIFDDIIDNLSRYFAGYTGPFAIEFIYSEKKLYAIDACSRYAYPGSYLFPSLFRNYGKTIADITEGNIERLDLKNKFGIQLTLDISSDKKTIIEIPKKFQDNFYFPGSIKIGSNYLYIPELGVYPAVFTYASNSIEDCLKTGIEVVEEFGAGYRIEIFPLLKLLEEAVKIPELREMM